METKGTKCGYYWAQLSIYRQRNKFNLQDLRTWMQILHFKCHKKGGQFVTMFIKPID